MFKKFFLFESVLTIELSIENSSINYV